MPLTDEPAGGYGDPWSPRLNATVAAFTRLRRSARSIDADSGYADAVLVPVCQLINPSGIGLRSTGLETGTEKESSLVARDGNHGQD